MSQAAEEDIWGIEENGQATPEEVAQAAGEENGAGNLPAAAFTQEQANEDADTLLGEPALTKKKKRLSPYTFLVLGSVVVVLIFGMIWVALAIMKAEPTRNLSPSHITSSVPSSSKIEPSYPSSLLDLPGEKKSAEAGHVQTQEPALQSIGLDEMSMPQAAEPEVGRGEGLQAQAEMDELRTQLQDLAATLKAIRQDASEAGALMRGQGMASISELDLQELLTDNEGLRAQLESIRRAQADSQRELAAAREEVASLRSQNEILGQKVAEVQRKNAALQAQIHKKAPGNGTTPAQTPEKRSPATPVPVKKTPTETTSAKLPFELQGLTTNFAVVRTNTGYQKWAIGTTIEGVKLLSIDPAKQKIQTSNGPMTLPISK